MFYTGTLGYFAQLIGFNQIGALQANTQYNLSAGYGTFGYEPKVNYTFGLLLSTGPGGVALDIPTNVVIASNNNDKQAELNFKLQSGIISSALEHATPEQLFNTDPNNPPNAFSAVKGLQIASSEGQRIYQITQANQTTTLPMLNLDAATEAEIQAAVNAGKEVITHTDLVSVPGYTGAGYIIFDPVSGDGAYKISGGENGGALFSGIAVGVSAGMMLTLATISGLRMASVAGGPTGYITGLIVALTLISQILLPVYVYNMSVFGDGGKIESCFETGIGLGLASSSILSAFNASGVAAAVAATGTEWLFGNLTGSFDSAKSCI